MWKNFLWKNPANNQSELLFRRQFLLGPAAYCPNTAWRVNEFSDGLLLSAHRDIDSMVLKSARGTIALVGYLVDPYCPGRGSREILLQLQEDTNSLSGLFHNVQTLSGRWVLFYKDAQDFVAITDPCGFRQIYYVDAILGGWCGSQPEIIRQVTGLQKSNNAGLKAFLASEGYRRQESAWVGDSTVYAGCRHLLPNHYLCMRRRSAVRYFPENPITAGGIDAAVEEAALILRRSIEGMSLRVPLMLPVTAGYDSRVLLAASRPVKDHVAYYVDRLGIHDDTHPDIAIPVTLAHELGLKFTVKNSTTKVPRWFAHLNRVNVTRARNLPKSRMIYSHYIDRTDAVNVNGNASEVCRNFFDKKLVVRQSELTAEDLSGILFHEKTGYAVSALLAWQKEVSVALEKGYNLLDMLYWEQRLGNWGAHFPAEQDIAIEEFSPFNNRRLISLLLSCPSHLRMAPDYELYRMLIREMWPEVLVAPFNPPHTPAASVASNNGLFKSVVKKLYGRLVAS